MNLGLAPFKKKYQLTNSWLSLLDQYTKLTLTFFLIKSLNLLCYKEIDITKRQNHRRPNTKLWFSFKENGKYNNNLQLNYSHKIFKHNFLMCHVVLNYVLDIATHFSIIAEIMIWLSRQRRFPSGVWSESKHYRKNVLNSSNDTLKTKEI